MCVCARMHARACVCICMYYKAINFNTLYTMYCSVLSMAGNNLTTKVAPIQGIKAYTVSTGINPRNS
jgi:hypothetical protein